jgi:DNA-binding MarR family transcriptional regulator
LQYNEIVDIILDNIKKIIFPEEWLKIDMTLSKQEVFTLMLVDREGEIIMSRVADYVNVPMSTATGIVDRLVKNGYLERNRSDSDRRVVMIRLTGKAKKIVEEIKNIGYGFFKLTMEALTDEERQFLSTIAVKIIGVINQQGRSSQEHSSNEGVVKKITIE